MTPLTKTQKATLDFLVEYSRQHGVMPTLIELMTRFDISSLATAHKRLRQLESKGWIRRDWNQARGITLVDPAAPDTQASIETIETLAQRCISRHDGFSPTGIRGFCAACRVEIVWLLDARAARQSADSAYNHPRGGSMRPEARTLGDSGGGREVYDGRNESWTDSKDSDKPKRRLGSPIDPADGTGGGGVVNGDVLEDPANPDGRRTELGFFGVGRNEYDRHDHAARSGMFQLFLRDDNIPPDPVTGSDDPKMVPFLTVYAGNTKGHPAAEFHPTIVAALRTALGFGPPPQYPDSMWSPSGLFVTQMQDDGNFVTYELARPHDRGRFRAIATGFDGRVDPNSPAGQWQGV